MKKIVKNDYIVLYPTQTQVYKGHATLKKGGLLEIT